MKGEELATTLTRIAAEERARQAIQDIEHPPMPTKSVIAGQVFDVEVREDLQLDQGEGQDDDHEHVRYLDVLGINDQNAQRILLEKDQGHDRFRETFLHEHVHAMIGLTGMRQDILAGVLEEQVVKRLTPVLLQYIRENPGAIRFLQEERS